MKKLSTYLFLIFFSFQTSSWTDDIRDFQIEGMSIGDSLLDYVSEGEITKKNIIIQKVKNLLPLKRKFHPLKLMNLFEFILKMMIKNI